jgi:hypothetical protein
MGAPVILLLALVAGQAAPAPSPPPAAGAPAAPAAPPAPLAGPLPLPAVPPPAAPPAAAPAGLDAPPEVLALLPPGRTPVSAQAADLDLDGAPEWIVVSRFLHPTRIDHGPRSAEWRAGQRIESRAAHELSIAGRERGALALRFSVEVAGNERQALLVEPLLGADGRRGRFPVVLTGARACAGTCGPVEAHLVVWDPKRKAFGDYAYVGAERVVLAADGAVELWFADRQPGDPICCPSGYTVTRLGMYGREVDTLSTRQVRADQLRQVLPPGGLIVRAPAPPAAPPAAPATPPAPGPARPPPRRP